MLGVLYWSVSRVDGVIWLVKRDCGCYTFSFVSCGYFSECQPANANSANHKIKTAITTTLLHVEKYTQQIQLH